MWHSIQKNMTWRAVMIAGLVAGTVFLVTHLVLTPLMLEVDSTLVLRYSASLLLGTAVLAEGDTLSLLVGVGVGCWLLWQAANLRAVADDQTYLENFRANFLSRSGLEGGEHLNNPLPYLQTTVWGHIRTRYTEALL
ncbi:MAG: hypothetical protein HC915_14110, partial [Anaerolineae bacterium]|nr:hypothetical protein [Anaerolineae bacterium]